MKNTYTELYNVHSILGTGEELLANVTQRSSLLASELKVGDVYNTTTVLLDTHYRISNLLTFSSVNVDILR